MRSPFFKRLMLLSIVVLFVVVGTYHFAFEFPVFEWKYSGEIAEREPKPAESAARLRISLAVEVTLVICLAVFLRWFNGKPILPNDKLLHIEGEPIKGEVLFPVPLLGHTPPKEEVLDDENSVG